MRVRAVAAAAVVVALSIGTGTALSRPAHGAYRPQDDSTTTAPVTLPSASIVLFRVTPTELPHTGGKVTVLAQVARAQTCTISVSLKGDGITQTARPTTGRCVNGLDFKVPVSRNSHHFNLVYRFGLVAHGPHGNSGTAYATVTVLKAPPPPPPPTTTTTTTTPPQATTCYPVTSSGHCYEPGEFCPAADHGMSGIAGDGERIICEDNNGWRWEPI